MLGASSPAVSRGYQGAHRLHNGVPQGPGHLIAIAGGAGGGVGAAAGGENHPGSVEAAPIRQYPGDRSLPGQNFLCPGRKYLHPRLLQGPVQGLLDAEGAVRLGKDPVAPLGF